MRRPSPGRCAATLSRGERVVLAILACLIAVAAPLPPAPAQAPGPELFAKPPETPLELWDAVDYLVRTGQPKQAVPYLNAFLKANPDDATLLEIRDRYGIGSVLNLEDYPETRSQAGALLTRFTEAAQRQSRDPERLRKFVSALAGTQAEQRYAVEQLRHAGPQAVPAVVEALSQPGLSDTDRGRIVANLARLGSPAVPAIVAMLDSPDETLAASAADALGRLGDARAIPFLTEPAARRPESIVTTPARQAIARLTGQSWASQPRSPQRVLNDEAERYLTHTVPLGDDPSEVWLWDGPNVSARPATREQIEGYHGLKLARQALSLDPTNHRAQTLVAALALQKAVEAVGVEAFPQQDPTGAYPLTVAAGPAVLGDVLRLALDRDLPDLAATATTVLGQVADRDALYIPTAPPHPLIAALDAPDRRTRFAAAQALVNLEPSRPFPGSSRVVPVLGQFAGNRTLPRVVVIDNSSNQANAVAATLHDLGYDPQTAATGPEGFRLAAGSADVEAIFIEPTTLIAPWTVRDLLTNLRADARTKDIPVILHSRLDLQDRLEPIIGAYPRIGWIVTPVNPQASGPGIRRELERLGSRPLSESERSAYAQHATALLAALANRPGNPFEGDLPPYEPALSAALSHPPIAPAATAALAELPDAEAQRSLADTALDTTRPEPARLQAAVALTRSLQRFGPLLTDAQERRLVQALDESPTPALRNTFAAVLGALRPEANLIGPRLQAVDPEAILNPPDTTAPAPAPRPEAVPAPPAPESTSGATPADPPLRLLTHRRFRIPFEVAAADRDRVQALRLVVSRDLGRSWQPAGVARPDEPAFPTFTAPDDGEYWFAIQTLDRAGRLAPADDEAHRPCMKLQIIADRTATAPVEPRR